MAYEIITPIWHIPIALTIYTNPDAVWRLAWQGYIDSTVQLMALPRPSLVAWYRQEEGEQYGRHHQTLPDRCETIHAQKTARERGGYFQGKVPHPHTCEGLLHQQLQPPGRRIIHLRPLQLGDNQLSEKWRYLRRQPTSYGNDVNNPCCDYSDALEQRRTRGLCFRLRLWTLKPRCTIEGQLSVFEHGQQCEHLCSCYIGSSSWF